MDPYLFDNLLSDRPNRVIATTATAVHHHAGRLVDGVGTGNQLLDLFFIRRRDSGANRFNGVRHINEFGVILVD